jgi:polysaccharide biosynthesis/export protein
MASEMRVSSRISFGGHRGLVLWAISFIGAFLFFSPSQASSEYRLDIGDTLEIAVTGAPELQRRTTINLQGEASFPLIGEINAAGLTLSELRVKVRSDFSRIEYRTATTPRTGGAIKADEVSLSVVEYRPIYLNGDVALPGEKQYKPGISVRQTIAIAGGYDIARTRMPNALLETADLRAQYETLSTELAKEKIHAGRLLVDLGREKDLVEEGLPPISPGVLAELVQLEGESLRTKQLDFNKEKNHLHELIAVTERKVTSLSRQFNNEEEGARLDTEEMERVRGLFEKGLVPATRVLETRRETLLSATRALQTNVQLEETRRYLEETRLRLSRLDDLRKIGLLDELQAANIRIATLQAQVQAVSERLFYLGAAKSQMVLASAGKISIVVFRKNGDVRERVVANEDTQVFPGDVIEVSVEVKYVNQFVKN